MVATEAEGRGEVGAAPASADPPAASAAAGRGKAGETEGAEWAVVTRARQRGRPKGSGGQQKIQFASGTPTFEQASEATRKRKAETTMAERLEQVYALLEKVLRQHQEEREAVAAERKVEREERAKMAKEIETMKRLLQQVGQTPTAGPSPPRQATAGQGKTTYANVARTPSASGKAGHPAARDERVVAINFARTTTDTTDFQGIKKTLQEGVDGHDATKGLKITCLRPGPRERIDVIFTTKKEAEVARAHQQWAKAQVPGIRMEGERWYPIRCDGVAKRAVLETESEQRTTLRADVAETFAKENNVHGIDFTVAKTRWISSFNPAKKMGTLVLWLKSKLAADHLIATGMALFGATGAWKGSAARNVRGHTLTGPAPPNNTNAPRAAKPATRYSHGSADFTRNTRNTGDKRTGRVGTRQ
ncbi:hypothetical protein CKM354_000783800 [Cercospora kikuchii]|uniref:Uncharacterized protein n=1 Tax=Cercospora kikuchii TaxID=84275 RepID=A0A9P3CNI2_9PEZI|nr:uncharacterized protein CKM354_000783800 [Cercospora kikuchii]GIZ44647.1 hypothetical protein CKM354_000783800 [Cercospora kikuchii]